MLAGSAQRLIPSRVHGWGFDEMQIQGVKVNFRGPLQHPKVAGSPPLHEAYVAQPSGTTLSGAGSHGW